MNWIRRFAKSGVAEYRPGDSDPWEGAVPGARGTILVQGLGFPLEVIRVELRDEKINFVGYHPRVPRNLTFPRWVFFDVYGQDGKRVCGGARVRLDLGGQRLRTGDALTITFPVKINVLVAAAGHKELTR